MIKRIGNLILVSESSFAVNVHYCINHLFVVSINALLKDCGAQGVKLVVARKCTLW